MRRREEFVLGGKVVAISGAASGIGRALAAELARHGCGLALADIDESGLAETMAMVSSSGVAVSTHIVDVAELGQVEGWAADCMEHHGAVHVVINNAGVGLAAGVGDGVYEDIEWLIGVNLWGVIHGTRAFLPFIEQSGKNGAVVNISSVFGLIGVQGQSAYNAAKFAVRGFTESLRLEVLESGRPIHVACVHPGGIQTAIARNSRMTLSAGETREKSELVAATEKLFRHTPEKAARIIVEGLRRRRHRILIGGEAYLIDWTARLLPVLYPRILNRLAKLAVSEELPRFV